MSSCAPSASTSEPLTRRVEVDPERLAGWVGRFAARHGEVDIRPGADGKPDLTTAEAGAAILVIAPDGATATLTSPWPPRPASKRGPHAPRPREPAAGAGAGTEALERFVAEVRRPRTVGLLLVRRGGFAVGIAEGPELVDSKVGSRYVQGKTKAGGWSQQRYARRRDAQAQAAFAAAADAAARVLLPRMRDLDALVTGGDRAAATAVLEDARLEALAALPRARFLAVPDPRRRVLEQAVRRARAVMVDVHDPQRD